MLTWQEAWQRALYGPEGFYRQGQAPRDHFRTAAHAAPVPLAGALARLARQHGCSRVVDLGAGRGELATALRAADNRLSVHAADLVARPLDLDTDVTWWPGLAAVPPAVLQGSLVIAWELLDNVPTPVLEVDAHGTPRVLMLNTEYHESLGAVASERLLQWSDTWWPSTSQDRAPGERIEVGLPRDDLWAGLVRNATSAGRTVLLAVDYSHHHNDRPRHGSLAGFHRGRVVAPIPDGSRDVTAHVALDSVAAAGERAGAQTLGLTDQRTALCDLGLTGRLRPGEPMSAAALQRISAEAELIDPSGLGAFGWLIQQV